MRVVDAARPYAPGLALLVAEQAIDAASDGPVQRVGRRCPLRRRGRVSRVRGIVGI
jgi:hypothetical protein